MEEKLNTSEKIPDLGATESAVTTAEPMYTSGPSDRSISGENNTRVLKKNKIKWTLLLKTLKFLRISVNETDMSQILLRVCVTSIIR